MIKVDLLSCLIPVNLLINEKNGLIHFESTRFSLL
jgi:hypothetical protein